VKKFGYKLVTIAGFAAVGYGIDTDSAVILFTGVGVAVTTMERVF